MMPVIGSALVENSGPLSDRFWLADTRLGDVLFQPATGIGHELPHCHHSSHRAGIRHGVSVCAYQSQLVCGNASGEKQQRRRAGQFHAQHRQQRRNFDGHHHHRPQSADSPGVPCGECHLRRQFVCPSRQWPHRPPHGVRRRRNRGGQAGLRYSSIGPLFFRPRP